ncbi:MAG: hypothetical protein P8Z37_01200 [Acidobacteriota bacterium]
MTRTPLSIIFTAILIVLAGCGQTTQDREEPMLNDTQNLKETAGVEDDLQKVQASIRHRITPLNFKNVSTRKATNTESSTKGSAERHPHRG